MQVGFNADTGTVQVRLQVTFRVAAACGSGVTLHAGRLQHVLLQQGGLQQHLQRLLCRVCHVKHDVFSQLTLKGGVESMLMHYCPEVKNVEEVVDSDIEQASCTIWRETSCPRTRRNAHAPSPPLLLLQASNSQLKFVEEMTGGAGGA
jgi:hypothetical protein